MKIYKIIKKLFFTLSNTWENFIEEMFGMGNFTTMPHKIKIKKKQTETDI